MLYAVLRRFSDALNSGMSQEALYEHGSLATNEEQIRVAASERDSRLRRAFCRVDSCNGRH